MLTFDEIKTGQTVNTPKYNAQGMLVNPVSSPTPIASPITGLQASQIPGSPLYNKSNIDVPTPKIEPQVTTNLSGLSNSAPSNANILELIKENQKKQDELFSNITSLFTPTADEITAQQQYQDVQSKLNKNLDSQDSTQLSALAGIQKAEEQIIPMGAITGQQRQISNQANLSLQTLGVQANSLSRQQQNALTVLGNAQANRQQKLQAAQTLFQMNSQNLQNTLSLYKELAPQNVGSFTNKQTGDVSVAFKNPVTGQITSQVIGNVGSDKSYSSSQTIQDSKGNFYFVGVKPDGSVDTINLGVQGQSKQDQFLDFTETDDFGNQTKVYINPATGTRITSEGIYSSQPGDGSGKTRTDRNNNPTAMTVDVAKTLELKEGIDYVKGDKFPDSNLYTAKLLGDPMQTTIKALDTAAQNKATQAFYTNGGQQRWTHTALSDSEWLGMTQDQKQKVVLDMYQRENGKNGTLFDKASTEDFDAISKAAKSLSPALSEGARKAFLANIGSLTSSGDYKTAANDLITTAINSTGVGVQEKLIAKYTAINQLNDIQQLLQDYQSKGGKTDLFTGTFEQIQQKLGSTSSPELAGIANRILATVISYRQNVSGAAFTEAEAAQYANLFPGISKTPLLNEAKINSLKDFFNTDIRSILGVRIGATNYDNLIKLIETSKTDDFLKTLYDISPEEEYLQQYIPSTPQVNMNFGGFNQNTGLSQFLKPGYSLNNQNNFVGPVNPNV